MGRALLCRMNLLSRTDANALVFGKVSELIARNPPVASGRSGSNCGAARPVSKTQVPDRAQIVCLLRWDISIPPNRLLDGLLTPNLGRHIHTRDILRRRAASATTSLRAGDPSTIAPTQRCTEGIAQSATRTAPLQERLKFPQQAGRPATPKRKKAKPNT